MKHTKNTIHFVDGLVNFYSKWDKLSEQYILKIEDVAEFDMHKISSMILANDDDYANSATSFDNPFYGSHMLPSLIKFLDNSCDKQYQNDFLDKWKNGVTTYLGKIINDLLEERLEIYNEAKKYR